MESIYALKLPLGYSHSNVTQPTWKHFLELGTLGG
jgi:hypothetical protein